MAYNPENLGVFIIDDNEIDLELLEAMLRRMGFRNIVKSKSAEIALQLLKKNIPELFFIDIMLPGISGGEFRGLLKEIPGTEDIPVIFVSGIISKEEEKEIDGRLKSGEIIVAKPFSIEKIAKAIKECLRNKQ